jgi:hypothetical protein
VKLSFGHDKDSKIAFTIHTAGDPQGTLNLSINLAAPDFDAKELSLTVGSTASESHDRVSSWSGTSLVRPEGERSLLQEFAFASRAGWRSGRRSCRD